MARAYGPDDLDPEMKLLKNADDAWQADLALIRQITQEEQQAEADRALAARLGGITLNVISDDIRRQAIMLLDDFSDEDEDTSMFFMEE